VTAGAAGASRRPVLVADDDRDIRETVRELLELEGWPVVTARNGAEALEAMRRTRPALVLLDLVMPVMDGEEVCRRCQGDPELADIPLVIVSAAVGREERVRRLGAAGSLEKPVRIDTLLDVVRRFCGAPEPGSP
jgi:CheY-like chemotaxis protein